MEKLKSIVSAVTRYGSKVLQVVTAIFFILLIIFYGMARGRVDAYTRSFSSELNRFYQEGIDINIEFNETIPVKLAVPVGDIVDLSLLLPEDIPFSANVPIETTVRIKQDLKVPVDLPVVGRMVLDIPLDLDVPIEEVVAISTTVSLDQAAFHDPDAVIHIDNDIPVNIPIDLNVSLQELGLESLMENLFSSIGTLRSIFLLGRIDGAGDG